MKGHYGFVYARGQKYANYVIQSTFQWARGHVEPRTQLNRMLAGFSEGRPIGSDVRNLISERKFLLANTSWIFSSDFPSHPVPILFISTIDGWIGSLQSKSIML